MSTYKFNQQRNVVPWKLWVAVGVLLAVDLLLLLVWTGVDPLLRQVHNFPKEQSPDPEEDVEIQPQLEHCKSTHHTVWLSKYIFRQFTVSVRRNVFEATLAFVTKGRNFICKLAYSKGGQIFHLILSRKLLHKADFIK